MVNSTEILAVSFVALPSEEGQPKNSFKYIYCSRAQRHARVAQLVTCLPAGRERRTHKPEVVGSIYL